LLIRCTYNGQWFRFGLQDGKVSRFGISGRSHLFRARVGEKPHHAAQILEAGIPSQIIVPSHNLIGFALSTISDTMVTTPGSSSSTLSAGGRPTYSCTRCADRKVKCDRQRPCSACVKHNAHCIFNSVQLSRPRHKRVKVKALTDRLRHYEALLQERGIEDLSAPSLGSAQEVASNCFSPQNDSRFEITTERNKSLDPVQHGRGFNFIEK
jgi:hypothetical protein